MTESDQNKSVKCNKCGSSIEHSNALLCSPPEKGYIDQYYICQSCWETFIFPIISPIDRVDDPDSVSFMYTNWKGKVSKRHVIPSNIFFGSNEWHEEPQWLMEAYDLDKRAMRTFAMECVSDWRV